LDFWSNSSSDEEKNNNIFSSSHILNAIEYFSYIFNVSLKFVFYFLIFKARNNQTWLEKYFC
jgi:TRAP-type uncharacterized transport system fused permease subunit